jgi:phospholipid transport system substrate-binding protein
MMTSKQDPMHAVAIVTFFVAATSSLSAFAGPASESIKQTHAAVLQVLQDQDLQDPARAGERQQQLTLIMAQRFGCREMAQHLLGPHWSALVEGQRAEFVRLFRLLLVKNYTEQIDRNADQRIDYLDEQSHNGRVRVRTRLIAPHRELLLEFWLFERLGDWLVYDVVVDGISLIQNYRGQIMSVLRLSSYDTLVEKMRQKVCPHGCREGK